jgi:UDP-glucose 4-epimerase
MKPTILVTGGTGYIGSHTAVELLNEGYEVVIIDNLSNSEKWIADRIEQITNKKVSLHIFDICDTVKLREMLAKTPNIKAIINFAAYKAVGESVEKPLDYYRNNVVSLINLLEAMKECNIPNIVFSSSCTVYGQPEKLPVTEQSPILKATSPYGNTKQMCEDIITDTIAVNPTLKSILLRYFNPIGAHPSALIGELPRGVPNNLVPFITQTAMGKRKELKVFGNDYNTPDGSCIRDYIDVVDLAKAHVVAVNRLLENKPESNIEIFNLGTGNGISVIEMIDAFEKASGVKVPHQIVGRRAGDVEKVWADTSKANKILGWKAEIPLIETLRAAWNWEKTLI